MANKNDLRVIKTKKVLFEALLTLMKKKTFEQIKISDICNEAMINRSTFYAHYEDKYELLLALIEDMKESLLNELKKNENDELSKKYFMELLKLLTEHIEERRDVYSAILSNNQNGMLIDILLDVTNKDLNQRFKGDPKIVKSGIPGDIIAKYYVSAIVGVGIDWVINKNKYTKEELLTYLNKLIPDNI